MVFSANNSILSTAETLAPHYNPSTVKLLIFIRWTPAAQCCLPGGISSLLAPSPSHDKQHISI
jgi:hypothetical protein